MAQQQHAPPGAQRQGRRACGWCGKARGEVAAAGGKLRLCSRCKAACYCSPECQRSAYPEHKAECLRLAAARQQQGA